MRLAAAAVALTASMGVNAATFEYEFIDAPGTGFNDTTPVTPVPGNSGTTLGEQRRILLAAAAARWAGEVTSNVVIRIEAGMEGLSCNSSGGTLAQAGTYNLFSNFSGAQFADVSYPQALANALHGSDLDPAFADIRLRVNDEVDDTTTGCFTSLDGFYYGTDGSVPDGRIELITTLLHELGHGLGFTSFVESSGRFLGDLPGVFDLQVFDIETTRAFEEMSLQQRSIASRNDPFLVWTGPAANSAADAILEDARAVVINSPGAIAGAYDAIDAPGTPAIPPAGISGQIIVVEDDNGRPNDGCDDITNEGALNGNIALILRSSSCNWWDVAFYFEQADIGTTALLVADNNANLPADVSQAFSNPASDFVSTVGVGRNLYDDIVGQTAAVNGAIGTDPSNQAGTQNGFIRLYAPSGFDNGSSVSHWSSDVKPDLLMEPSKGDLDPDQLDITVAFLRDLGWPVDDIFFNGFERP